jgi:hypothetical protein
MQPIGPTIRRLMRKIQARRDRYHRRRLREGSTVGEREGADMPEVTISPKEFIRYLDWRIGKEVLAPLVPYHEALARFGADPVVVTISDVGDATLASPGGRGRPTSGETSPGRRRPGT